MKAYCASLLMLFCSGEAHGCHLAASVETLCTSEMRFPRTCSPESRNRVGRADGMEGAAAKAPAQSSIDLRAPAQRAAVGRAQAL